MTLKFIAFLLTVQTVIPADLTVQAVIPANLTVHTAIYANETSLLSWCAQYLTPIDTLSYGPFKTPIFKNKEVMLAQPVITVESCPVIAPDFGSYYIQFALKIDKYPLKTAGRVNTTQEKVDIFGSFTGYGDFKDWNNNRIPVKGHSTLYGELLIIQCGTIEKCSRIWAIINTNTSQLEALRFYANGVVRKSKNLEESWEFSGIPIATPIKLNCSWTWIKNVEDTRPWSVRYHDQGFMHEVDNYWLGLTALHFITFKKDRPRYKCKLRVELEDWKGNTYWGQWNQFQVMGAEDNYHLTVGEEVKGTQINGLAQYHDMKFNSTGANDFFNLYDYNQYFDYYLRHLSEKISNKTCSTRYTYVVWWINTCFSVGTNFNLVPMRKSLMKVNCDWK